jgi:Fe2+ or Zn2+ uptake regulation protein
VSIHDAVEARLRDVGQRYTAGRRQLVARLDAAARPLVLADLLIGEGGALPQSSAYRNLGVLEQVGVVHRVHTSGAEGRYELAEHLTEHHHHLICESCGAVEDVTVPAALERTLAKVADQIAGAAGFTPTGHRLDLIGTCPACAS